MKKQTKKTSMSAGAMIGGGIAIAAASAAAYVLFGKDGKKNRKAVRGWAVKMKGEVIEQFEKAKELTEPVYHSIVNEIAAKYAKVKDVDQKELNAMVSDMRKHWKALAPKAQKKGKSKSKSVVVKKKK